MPEERPSQDRPAEDRLSEERPADARAVAEGDRFQRAKEPGRVFRVIGVRDVPHMPAHALLKPEAGGDTVTVAMPALDDPALWRRVAG